MLTDNEIKGVSEDALRFNARAQTLQRIICSSGTPITIGIYGEWGSGKTSLMRMTEELLETGEMVKTVWFDAWKFDKTHDLRVALINRILRKMEKDESIINEALRNRIENLLKKVNWLGLGKIVLSSFLPLPSLVTQVMDSLMESFLKNPEEIPGKTLELIGDFEDEFSDLTREYVGDNGRLVVFVDDLDRCIPEKAIDVLEAIKLFLNVERSVFVIGADKKVIEEGIFQKYGEKSENWGRNYLDKIIQIPFNLPPLRREIIQQFISNLSMPEEIKRYADIIAEVGDNPRTIKRLLNKFEVQIILAEMEELNIENEILAKLAVIEFKWPDFYTELVGIYSENQTNLVKILEGIIESDENKRERKLEGWPTLRKYLSDERLMEFLLEEKPFLANRELDIYIYMIRSTTELKESMDRYFSIAFSFVQREEYAKALENFEKVIELDPNDEKAWYYRGIVLGELRRYEEAIKCYDKALELNPNDEKVLYTKGFALSIIRKFEEALTCYNKALELNPKFEEAWSGRGFVFAKLKKYDEAIQSYYESIELNPTFENTWRKGIEIAKLGRYKEAIKCYDKALELNPNDERVLYNKGFALGELRRYEEAIKCYDKALELNPTFGKAWDGKGNVLTKLKRYKEAIKCYDKALELDPNDERVLYNKGFALGELRRYEEAIKCYDRALELDPTFKAAQQAKNLLSKKI